MTLSSNRILYKETIYELPEFSNYEERDTILTKIHMYGELQKSKGFKDNIYRTYSFGYNSNTKKYEVVIEMLGDTIKETSKNDFIKTMLAMENQAISETVNAKRYIRHITMEGLL